MTTVIADDATVSPVTHDTNHLTDDNIEHDTASSRTEIHERIQALDREWDIERVLKINASALALAGLLPGARGDKRLLALPAAALAFLLQHGVQGWCPPVPVLPRHQRFPHSWMPGHEAHGETEDKGRRYELLPV